MGENPENYNQRLAKSAFKDILISANNDDVIIPTSATFDKVVLHIGIGNRSGVTIEKPPVGDGKKLITSVEYATRKFKKSYYQRDRKDTGAIENVSEDTIEPGEKFRRNANNQTDIDRHMLQLASSFYSTTPLETETASAIVSETGLTKQVQPENNKNDADTVEAKLEKISTLNINDVLIPDVKDRNQIVALTKLSKGVESQVSAEPNIKPDIDFDKFDKTCLDALRAKLSIKEIQDAIDKAYENEMLAIAADEEANVSNPDESWQPKATGSCLNLADDAYLSDYFANSERGSGSFAESTSDTLKKKESLCENDLSKHTNTEDDTGTCISDKGATENVSEDTVEPGEKFRRNANNQTDIDRHMLQLASSFYSTTPLETETASAIVSDTGLTKQVQPENNKNDAGTVEAKLEKISTLNINDVLIPDVKDRNEIVAPTKLSKGVESQVSAEPNIKPDIDFDKFDQTCLDALRAKLSIKEIRDAIDKAYENEMLAIAVDEEANVPKPNEIWQPKSTGSCLSLADDTYLADYFAKSEQGSKTFASEKEDRLCEEELTKQANAENNIGTCIPDDVTNTKIRLPDAIEKYIMISKDNGISIAEIGLNDQECISAVVKISTVDQECGERVCIESLQTKPATNGEITQREDREREQGSVSDLHDEDEDKDSVTLETGIHVESTDTMSDSDEPETVVPVHIEPDKLIPLRDTPNDNVDIESYSIIEDKGAVDEISDSDTLVDIVDMELDDEVVDIRESDDEIVDNIDDGIEDIEAIVLQDQDELDVTAARNYITGNSTNDNGITGDDDNVFGILDIYMKSNLHFDVDKITAAEQCDEKKDYGYIFFSFSTFFK